MDKYSQFVEKENILVKIAFDDLLGFADNVVGVATMLLFELAIMREKVTSLSAGAKLPFVGEFYGLTIPASYKKSLSAAMRSRKKQNVP